MSSVVRVHPPPLPLSSLSFSVVCENSWNWGVSLDGESVCFASRRSTVRVRYAPLILLSLIIINMWNMIKKAIRWYCKQSMSTMTWLPTGTVPPVV